MSVVKYAIVLSGLFAAPLAVQAQTKPDFSADQIISRFAKPGDGTLGASRGLGQKRGVCVGTEAECRTSGQSEPVAAGIAPPSFDLRITFALDSDRLTPAARQNLNEFAKALNDPRLKVFSFAVEGHTDARGTDEHNNDLSKRRAEAVVRHLESLGIERERILPRALGSSQPRTADPMDPSNRRVETRLAQ